LLDAAERLFAEHGYDGVGIRQLVDEAKVNLGAVTYHFGSKEALFIETFMRRFRSTNAERLRSLRETEAQADGRPLSVEKIVECMIRPPFEAGLEYPVFHLFLARNLFKPPPFLHAAIQRELAPNVAAFIAALRRTLPELPEDLIHLRTVWAMGVLLTFSVRAGEIPGIHNKKIREPLLREMVRFISAGLQSETALPANKRPRLPLPPRPLLK
jgi:AcrR family transcriptional regulator